MSGADPPEAVTDSWVEPPIETALGEAVNALMEGPPPPPAGVTVRLVVVVALWLAESFT